MPTFSKSFDRNNNNRKICKEELVRCIRFAIASEFEAIQLYEQIEEATENPEARKLLHEIAGDESVHVGNFLQLLKILTPEEEESYKE